MANPRYGFIASSASMGFQTMAQYSESVRTIQEHFINCLHEGCEPETSGHEQLKNSRLVKRHIFQHPNIIMMSEMVNMSEIFRPYGTPEPPLNPEHFRMAVVFHALEEAALRHIKVGDIEIIRRIAFLVRDRDWGTPHRAYPSFSSKRFDTSFPFILSK